MLRGRRRHGVHALNLTAEQRAVLEGSRGRAAQMGMRLLVDLAQTAGATELVPITRAHLSGVSPLTGGLGLRRFLARLTEDPEAAVAVPTTLNSAGCDEAQFAAMRIAAPDFLEHHREIVGLYEKLGVQPTLSCVPYEWAGGDAGGTAAWAESNAICFGNSYCGLRTNRESGLSALAAALTGFTPRYGLHDEAARQANLRVRVTATLGDPTDFSILGDWIGRQRRPDWKLPYGPIPYIEGLPEALTHEQRKALTAAAANYGCALLYLAGHGPAPSVDAQAELVFDDAALAQRYADLAPTAAPSLVTLGCPQASLGEIRAAAELLRGERAPAAAPPLWIFTSRATRERAEAEGLGDVIRKSGALLLVDTCPEVVPYDRRWVDRILTNSMKAEHYLKSGLNGIPTAVLPLADCVAVALGQRRFTDAPAAPSAERSAGPGGESEARPAEGDDPARPRGAFETHGEGLPSQGAFRVRGEAFVTDTPITLLGFVNRETGVIEEPGHPAHGRSFAGKIAIFPKGSGSTVAPYVLLELHYRGQGPLAVVNTEIDQQSAPACSLEGIPYAHSFAADVIAGVGDGDIVELAREGDRVLLRVVSRA